MHSSLIFRCQGACHQPIMPNGCGLQETTVPVSQDSPEADRWLFSCVHRLVCPQRSGPLTSCCWTGHPPNCCRIKSMDISEFTALFDVASCLVSSHLWKRRQAPVLTTPFCRPKTFTWLHSCPPAAWPAHTEHWRTTCMLKINCSGTLDCIFRLL